MTAGSNPDSLETLRIPIGLLNELSVARSLKDTLDCFAKWSHIILDADRCSVSLQDGDDLVVTGLSGHGALPTGARMPIDKTFVGHVFATREAAILTDLADQPYLETPKLAEAGMACLMIAPLLAQDRCFGALAFAFATDLSQDAERFAIIGALGRCYATQLLVIEEMRSMEQKLKTDPLTQTFNRRHFEDIGRDLWQKWQADQESFALAAVDIDHFKSVNDTYGHAAGDSVLRAVAERLKTSLRRGDEVVRMGGEEFLLILRDCTSEVAARVAQRARKAVVSDPISIEDRPVDVSVSVGVATVRDQDADVDSLERRADEALYRAKSDGRNRVVRSSRTL